MQSAYIKGTKDKVIARNAHVYKVEEFQCTNCGCILRLRDGAVRVPHFYHRPDESCNYSYGESEEHIRIKNSIYDTLKERYTGKGVEVDMEYTGIKGCRPDVFLNGKKEMIAIEIQASTIDVRDIIDRTERYYNENVGVIWVLPFEDDRVFSNNPNDSFKRFKMKEYEKMFYFMYNKTLVFWDEDYEAFTVVDFQKAYSSDTEFYSKEQGSMMYFKGKSLKNSFDIVRLYTRVYPEDFKKWKSQTRFDMKGYGYSLPKSILWKYNIKK